MGALDRRLRLIGSVWASLRNLGDPPGEGGGGGGGGGHAARSRSQSRDGDVDAGGEEAPSRPAAGAGGGAPPRSPPGGGAGAGSGGGGGGAAEASRTGAEVGGVPPGGGGGGGGAQYRLEARRKSSSLWKRLLCVDEPDADGAHTAGASLLILDPNRFIALYLHWTFRTSFALLLLSMILGFVTWTVAYAGLIMLSGYVRPQCVASDAFADWDGYGGGARFADAYQLSWTTFSTVGYGVIYPQTSAGWPRQTDCVGMKILCSSEAFFGVLFSGLCGAVLFGKVTRIQGFAQVAFSDPIVVRYGGGVSAEEGGRGGDGDGDDEGDGEGGDDTNTAAGGGGPSAAANPDAPRSPPPPCPVLEFRVVNLLNSARGGEIMDATLNCVASVDPESSDRSRSNSSRRALPSISEGSAASASTACDRSVGYGGDGKTGLLGGPASPGLASASVHRQNIREDGSDLAPRHSFVKVEIESSDHPFFKRVWVARHVLDERSPLLTRRARRSVRKNRGRWPEELNDHTGVRESVRFNQILVSLSGTCNVNGASVYAQKIYDRVDVNVGYRFVNVLYRGGSDNALRVDATLLNDVTEQRGGGGAVRRRPRRRRRRRTRFGGLIF